MKLLLGAFTFAASLFAADSDFNGRWNLTLTGDPRSRAWWLEISGAGTREPKGRFVGAPGGQMDDIAEMRVAHGELVFYFERNYGYGSKEDRARKRRGTYRARLIDNRLTGTFSLDGDPVLQFTGERAPDIRDKDDASWKKGKPVPLFNGRDLTGWKTVMTNVSFAWSVKNGFLTNSEGAADIVSREKFWNFDLHAEYRVGPKSNSGIALRDRYEVQIMEDHGRPVDGHSMGSVYSRIVPTENASKPAGEWQTMDIRLVGRTVTIMLNGKKIVDRKQIEGLTAMAHDANEAAPGPLSLQGDHGLVEFRALVVTPLTR